MDFLAWKYSSDLGKADPLAELHPCNLPVTYPQMDLVKLGIFWKRKFFTKYQWQSIFKQLLQISHTAAHRYRGSLVWPIWAGSSARCCCISVLFCRRQLRNCIVCRFVKPAEGCTELQLRLWLREGSSRDSFPSWTNSHFSYQMTAQYRCIAVLWSWCICCPRHQERRWLMGWHWCRKLSG